MFLTMLYLRSILEYDPDDGWFLNRVQRGQRGDIGDVAGNYDKDGYIVIQIQGKKYKAHRLAWMYMTGEWPEHEIDHKDGNPANNIWTNLREATRGENCVNANRELGESGFRGVKFDSSSLTWRARIGYGYQRTWLGPFDSAEEAYEAYLQAADVVHGKYAIHKRNSEGM